MKKTTKFVSILIILCCLLSALTISGASASDTSCYYEQFADYMQEALSLNDDDCIFYVDVLSVYSSDKGFVNITSTTDEAASLVSADYVLAFCSTDVVADSIESDVFGDYYVTNGVLSKPYAMCYHILTPEDGKIYTLREAYDSGLDGIELLFSDNLDVFQKHSSRAGMIGDVNYDEALNVKDAALIQKQLADLETIQDDLISGLSDPEAKPGYVSDFNHDGDRSVKDATAIQKHIAGLPY